MQAIHVLLIVAFLNLLTGACAATNQHPEKASPAPNVRQIPVDDDGCPLAPVGDAARRRGDDRDLWLAAQGVFWVQEVSDCGSRSWTSGVMVRPVDAARDARMIAIEVRRVDYGRSSVAGDWAITRVTDAAIHVHHPVQQCTPTARWNIQETEHEVRLRFMRPSPQAVCTLLLIPEWADEYPLKLSEPLGSRTIVLEYPEPSQSYRRNRCPWVARSLSLLDSARHPEAADAASRIRKQARRLIDHEPTAAKLEDGPTVLAFVAVGRLVEELKTVRNRPVAQWSRLPDVAGGVRNQFTFFKLPYERCGGTRAPSRSADSATS